MSQRDLIEVVLEALLEEFNPIVAIVNSQAEIISLMILLPMSGCKVLLKESHLVLHLDLPFLLSFATSDLPLLKPV